MKSYNKDKKGNVDKEKNKEDNTQETETKEKNTGDNENIKNLKYGNVSERVYSTTTFKDIKIGEYHPENIQVNVIYSTKPENVILPTNKGFDLNEEFDSKKHLTYENSKGKSLRTTYLGDRNDTLRTRSVYGDISGYTSIIQKPETIKSLEEVLSEAYSGSVIITKIRDLPMGRKKVKEVRFLLNNKLSKVWLFKADPKNTSRELMIYKIAYENGIPTGKPIGLAPETDSKYKYDIAIIGGIVEHAGDAYSELLKNLELRSEKAQECALTIVGLIAHYQKALTDSKKRFEDLDIIFREVGPEKEIRDRMIMTLKNPSRFENITGYMNELYSMQSPYRVVSHGDTHDKNIVTLAEYDIITNQNSLMMDKFGIIDWGAICIDHPYSDVMNFWIHHKRIADFMYKKYDYDYTDIIKEYDKHMNLPLGPDDALIQNALWNIYEMYDPFRTDKKEANNKGEYHVAATRKALNELIDKGYVPAIHILSEIESIIKQFPF